MSLSNTKQLCDDGNWVLNDDGGESGFGENLVFPWRIPTFWLVLTRFGDAVDDFGEV
jgi:hypothetical protein